MNSGSSSGGYQNIEHIPLGEPVSYGYTYEQQQ